MFKNLCNRRGCLLVVTLLACVSSCKYSTNSDAKTTKKNLVQYSFPTPEGWQVERFPFPIAFAPQITYKGAEDIRFAPGWGSITSEEHWTYAFLWWLEGSPKIDTIILHDNLKAYYTGLVGRNIKERNIPASKIVPIVATIKKIGTAAGDIETFSGTVTMLDYIDLTYSSITLNYLIHKKECNSKNHTALLFQISPQPFKHQIWQQLNKLNTDFKCVESQPTATTKDKS